MKLLGNWSQCKNFLKKTLHTKGNVLNSGLLQLKAFIVDIHKSDTILCSVIILSLKFGDIFIQM